MNGETSIMAILGLEPQLLNNFGRVQKPAPLTQFLRLESRTRARPVDAGQTLMRAANDVDIRVVGVGVLADGERGVPTLQRVTLCERRLSQAGERGPGPRGAVAEIKVGLGGMVGVAADVVVREVAEDVRELGRVDRSHAGYAQGGKDGVQYRLVEVVVVHAVARFAEGLPVPDGHARHQDVAEDAG